MGELAKERRRKNKTNIHRKHKTIRDGGEDDEEKRTVFVMIRAAKEAKKKV